MGKKFIKKILGFNEDSPTTPLIAPQIGGSSWMVAPNIAKFNSYNSKIIHSDLVNSGIQLNNNFYQIISMIPITSESGSLNIYEAHDPYPFSTCRNLIGENNCKYQSSFWVTDEKNIPLQQSENWNIVVMISYDLAKKSNV